MTNVRHMTAKELRERLLAVREIAQRPAFPRPEQAFALGVARACEEEMRRRGIRVPEDASR